MALRETASGKAVIRDVATRSAAGIDTRPRLHLTRSGPTTSGPRLSWVGASHTDPAMSPAPALDRAKDCDMPNVTPFTPSRGDLTPEYAEPSQRRDSAISKETCATNLLASLAGEYRIGGDRHDGQ